MLPQSLPHLTFRPASNDDLKPTVKLVFGVLREVGLQPDSGTDADYRISRLNQAKELG